MYIVLIPLYFLVFSFKSSFSISAVSLFPPPKPKNEKRKAIIEESKERFQQWRQKWGASQSSWCFGRVSVTRIKVLCGIFKYIHVGSFTLKVKYSWNALQKDDLLSRCAVLKDAASMSWGLDIWTMMMKMMRDYKNRNLQ